MNDTTRCSHCSSIFLDKSQQAKQADVAFLNISQGLYVLLKEACSCQNPSGECDWVCVWLSHCSFPVVLSQIPVPMVIPPTLSQSEIRDVKDPDQSQAMEEEEEEAGEEEEEEEVEKDKPVSHGGKESLQLFW